VNTLFKKEILYETGKERATEILQKVKNDSIINEFSKEEFFSDIPELLEVNK
jgi:hypothetical protein